MGQSQTSAEHHWLRTPCFSQSRTIVGRKGVFPYPMPHFPGCQEGGALSRGLPMCPHLTPRLRALQILTTYRNLHCLQLHANSIQGLGEVDKLAVLPHLRSLTLHGNPIEEEKGYRYPGMCPAQGIALPAPAQSMGAQEPEGGERSRATPADSPCLACSPAEGVGVATLPRCPCQAGSGHRTCSSRPLLWHRRAWTGAC